MAQENNSGLGRIFGQALWELFKALWKICLMLIWGALKITEIIAGQIAHFLKRNLLKINN